MDSWWMRQKIERNIRKDVAFTAGPQIRNSKGHENVCEKEEAEKIVVVKASYEMHHNQ